MIVDLLNIAKNEEKKRREVTVEEVLSLFKILQKMLKNINTASFLQIKKHTLNNIREDIIKTAELNQLIKNKADISQNATYPLKTNKNIEGLFGAEFIIKTYFDILTTNDIWQYFPIVLESETILNCDEDSDIKGNSRLNFLQIAFVSILYVILNNDKIALLNLFYEESIYDINSSPNLQGTALLKEVMTNLSFDIDQWMYFYQDKKSPSFGELLYFHIGYAFGGSAGDLRYKSKEFRAEDCFTSIIRWLSAEENFTVKELQEISTLDVEKYYDACYSGKKTVYSHLLTKMFEPIGNTLSNVKEGDIFAYRTYDILNSPFKSDYKYSLNEKGHIGVVTEVNKLTGFFQTLSYSRDIPKKEGFGFEKESIYNPYKKYMFFKINSR